MKPKLNAYELKEEASKIAREKGVPQSLLNIIDYTKENADSIKTKIEEIEVTYKQALQEGINDRMKEKKNTKDSSWRNYTNKQTKSKFLKIKIEKEKNKNGTYYQKCIRTWRTT